MPDIPNETLNHIVSFIDDQRGLLPLNLTSKRFASVVQPHADYRVIRCTLGTTDLWERLSENTALAQNVRSLEIQRQYLHFTMQTKDIPPPIVPKEFVIQAHDKENRKLVHVTLPVKDVPQLREAERALIRAIKNMSNLKSFTWAREAPLLDSILDKDVDDDVWTALRDGCPALENLCVMDASENEDNDAYIRPVHHSAIWTLRQDLKSFSYHSYAYRHIGQQVPVDELSMMLRRCLNLEMLSLGFTLYSREVSDDDQDVSTANLDELLADMHWPKLHTLTTASIHVTPSTAASFFKCHPTITTLEIWENTSQAKFIKDETFEWDIDVYPLPSLSFTLFPSSLPNLVYARAPDYMCDAIDAAQATGTEPFTRAKTQSSHVTMHRSGAPKES